MRVVIMKKDGIDDTRLFTRACLPCSYEVDLDVPDKLRQAFGRAAG
jgi:hypothetical protein